MTWTLSDTSSTLSIGNLDQAYELFTMSYTRHTQPSSSVLIIVKRKKRSGCPWSR